MIGFFTIVKELSGFLCLLLVIVYILKFTYFGQDPRVFISWRSDDAFFLCIPFAAALIVCLWCTCWLLRGFQCQSCLKRRHHESYVPLNEL
jgi:hypothetical protein